jgi:hypothetical protein
MYGIISLFLAFLALFAFTLVASGRRRQHANRPSRHSAHGETPQSMRRVSRYRWFMPLGEWICPHRGTRTGVFASLIDE